ncbi:STAS domain-containing protein [Longimicrobium terrae]|uniref:RsbT co-antagonist protein RsbR n=1 Tax=Longimicrobium terrae TaxID=1639882 RepID=A0A841H4Z1_9BACT|nr:STAS domain-containing protein [Longimicrobium terrae]MBB4638794.1 rsbT co-antagonist protein RsbR [Longimicrobium terrae]MBB6073033.1 rsbT co-antagonist protein RsbR [Longimicrobium terrae]NNC33156.1 STAS domain-containing protein [Longimicrobium terrae]
MTATSGDLFASALSTDRDALLDAWLREQASARNGRAGLISAAELRQQGAEFIELLNAAVVAGGGEVAGAAFNGVRDLLSRVSRQWALQGLSPTETATFVFSLKQPVFSRIQQDGADSEARMDGLWRATAVLDALGLFTTEVYQRSREEVIHRQQMELMELSTPVVKLWDGILALPLIGTLDSARTQVVMESLLQRIVDTGCAVAIIDITGVPMVDTLVAQHLIKTVAAARLMGAECIISGIRPQIAQTIVHLGVDLGPVATKATLADAFRLALRQTGQSLVAAAPAQAARRS